MDLNVKEKQYLDDKNLMTFLKQFETNSTEKQAS